MRRELFASIGVVIRATSAGPLSVASSGVSRPDDANLSLIVGSNPALDRLLAHSEALEIGPYRAPFARLVSTSPDFHSSLVARGYWVFPATSLAALCGIQTGA